MPKGFIYSVRNYGSRKIENDLSDEEDTQTKTKMVTRSLFKPGQDTYECLTAWQHGTSKRHCYRDKKRDSASKSYHHLSLVTRFYLGLRMTRMRTSDAFRSKLPLTCDQSEVTSKTSNKTAINPHGSVNGESQESRIPLAWNGQESTQQKSLGCRGPTKKLVHDSDCKRLSGSEEDFLYTEKAETSRAQPETVENFKDIPNSQKSLAECGFNLSDHSVIEDREKEPKVKLHDKRAKQKSTVDKHKERPVTTDIEHIGKPVGLNLSCINRDIKIQGNNVTRSNSNSGVKSAENLVPTVIDLTKFSYAQSRSLESDRLLADSFTTEPTGSARLISYTQRDRENLNSLTGKTTQGANDSIHSGSSRFFSQGARCNTTSITSSVKRDKGQPRASITRDYNDGVSKESVAGSGNNENRIPNVRYPLTTSNFEIVRSEALTIANEPTVQETFICDRKGDRTFHNIEDTIGLNKERSSNSIQNVSTCLASNDFYKMISKNFVPNQFNTFPSHTHGTELSSLNKTQIRVATLGPNIPVFLTACDTLNQDTANRKAKQYLPIPPFYPSSIESYKNMPVDLRYEENTDSFRRLTYGNSSVKFHPKKEDFVGKPMNKPPMQTTCRIDETERPFPPPKYRREYQQDMNLIDSAKEQKLAFKQSICSESSTNRLKMLENHAANSALNVYPLFQDNKIKNTQTLNTEGRGDQKENVFLFNQVPGTFQPQASTPIISHSRHSDSRNGFSAPYMQSVRDPFNHDLRQFIYNKNTLGLPQSQAFLKDNYQCTRKYPFGRNACKVTISSIQMRDEDTTSSHLANEVQSSRAVSLMRDTQNFATPAFDLLTSVARAPAAFNNFRMENIPSRSGPHTSTSNNVSPYLASLPRAESLSRVYQTKKAFGHAVFIPSNSNANSYDTCKDQGYDMLFSKRSKSFSKDTLDSTDTVSSFGSNVPYSAASSEFETMRSLYETSLADGSRTDKIDTRSLFAAKPGNKVNKQECKGYGQSWMGSKSSENESNSSNFVQNFGLVDNTALFPNSFDHLRSKISLPVSHTSSIDIDCITTATMTKTTSSNKQGSSTKGNSTKQARVDNMCPVCCRLFTRSWLLKGHMRTHTGERPYQCSHPTCQKAFADRSNLRSHMLTHTTAAKTYSCPRCGRTFSQKRYLHKHAIDVCKMTPDS